MKFIKISDKELSELSNFIYKNFGIQISEAKKSILANRLQKVLRNNQFNDFKSYFKYLVSDKTGEAVTALINRVSTNYSYFNRGEEHFELFVRRVLPEVITELRSQNENDIRVWSAGCATGEEPYMLAMLMREYFGEKYGFWDAGVLATDISQDALDYARKGVYTEDRIKRLSLVLRGKYFSKCSEDEYAIKEIIKDDITFRRYNLMNRVFPFKKKFHAIFCRNVMIYFDRETINELLEKFYSSLEPGGYFFIGHSETLDLDACDFEYLTSAAYKKSKWRK